MFRGYTVIAPVSTTHLTEIIRDNMSELLSYAETQKLLDDLDQPQQKLITDLIPNQISVERAKSSTKLARRENFHT